jgi:ribonuclease R
MLGGDFFTVDEKRHRLVGRRTGAVFALGDAIQVKLAEADTVTGSLAFVPAGGERAGGNRTTRYNSTSRGHR